MKRQYHPRSRSKPRHNTPRSCPQSRRASLSSEELSCAPLNLEALNDGLMSILECPVCFETMLPPIFQCKEGHNVCHTCKEKIKTCPMCRQLLIGRNVTVEHISNKLLRHCANQDVGCKELVSLDNKEHHERTCPFRKYECLPGKPLNCVWSGTRFDILGHMKSAHPELASVGSDTFDLNKGKHEISLITALDEIFWLHLKRDPRKKLFFALVQYIGPEANASNYLYKFTIFSKKNGNKVSYTYQTPSDTANVDDLFNRGQAAVMNYKSLASFIDDKQKLPLKLKMKLMKI